MTQQNKRKSWKHTIKRWFGLKAEAANDVVAHARHEVEMTDINSRLNDYL